MKKTRLELKYKTWTVYMVRPHRTDDVAIGRIDYFVDGNYYSAVACINGEGRSIGDYASKKEARECLLRRYLNNK